MLTVVGVGVLVGSLIVASVSLADAAPGPSGSEVEVKNDSGSPLPVSGTLSVGNLPATQTVSGSVSVTNLPATQSVSGTVTVGNTSPIAVTQAAPSFFSAGGPWATPVSTFTGTREFGTGNAPLVIDRINARCDDLHDVVFTFYSGGVLRTMMFSEEYGRSNGGYGGPAVIDVHLGDVVADANTNISFLARAATSNQDEGDCSDSIQLNGITVTGHRP